MGVCGVCVCRTSASAVRCSPSRFACVRCRSDTADGQQENGIKTSVRATSKFPYRVTVKPLEGPAAQHIDGRVMTVANNKALGDIEEETTFSCRKVVLATGKQGL